MADTESTTKIYVVGREDAIYVKGAPDVVQAALIANAGNMVRLVHDSGGSVIVNPAFVTRLDSADVSDMPLIDT